MENKTADEWPEGEAIGQLIARIRVSRGKSQYALADALATAAGNPSATRNYVNRWESGRRIPTPYWRQQLSVVLSIPIDVLDRAAAVAKRNRDAVTTQESQTSVSREHDDVLSDIGEVRSWAVFAPSVEPGMIDRSDEFGALISLLTSAAKPGSSSKVVAIFGPGGLRKSNIGSPGMRRSSDHPRVLRDSLGRDRRAVHIGAGCATDLRSLCTPGACSTTPLGCRQAGFHFARVLADSRILIVIDNVWSGADF